ncbi:hypothetical protein [Streptomyces sp. WAC01280]|uniref:hypothetical protein n=1 Tax=Streptomyces sp. WAC01280 TaxID=2487424 RepID=UPI000F7A750C|nr:hypothetical protein [Streptomyces sp. WAC01280]RSS59569.1 hypothetical protein EF909_06740 [Streptomyces sp. WAC01280]
MQREQSFWASRRDTYARMMTALQSFDRAIHECLTAFKVGNFDDALLKKVREAGHEFEQVQFVMSLEAPHDPFIAAALKGAATRVRRLVTGAVAWRQDSASLAQSATNDQWFDDLGRELNKVSIVRQTLFQTMRNDLHREVGEDPTHYGVRVRVLTRKGRRERFTRRMIDRDLAPDVDAQGNG